MFLTLLTSDTKIVLQEKKKKKAFYGPKMAL